MLSFSAMARSKASTATVGAALALAALSACSSPATPPSGRRAPVTLLDYRISSSVTSVPAGIVSFDVHNRGPSTHEIVVFEADRSADQMPLGEDGLTVDEESPLVRDVGELSQVDIGRTESLVLRLSPGRYVLLCNLEGHYLGGMYLAMVVY